ncbi:MAG: hypothetical protein B1H03_06765 [Planctomycetales bacterium 4484_113]|nr:MAG: hypothetical protein B1H03_06765 [Planctomycetales bacterium 4484_113]
MNEPRPAIDNPALIEQLNQLNQRVRLYAQQIWQIPLAYLGLVLLSLAGSENVQGREPGLVMVFMGAVGILVFCHYLGLVQANDWGVKKIEETESKLGLDVTVRTWPLIVCPLKLLIVLIALAELTGGAVLEGWCSQTTALICLVAVLLLLLCCICAQLSSPRREGSSSPTK